MRIKIRNSAIFFPDKERKITIVGCEKKNLNYFKQCCIKYHKPPYRYISKNAPKRGTTNDKPNATYGITQAQTKKNCNRAEEI